MTAVELCLLKPFPLISDHGFCQGGGVCVNMLLARFTEVIPCLVFLMSSVRDMQQMYELWLELTNQNRRTDTSAVTPPPEDKQVTLTAEYTESMVSTSYISW